MTNNNEVTTGRIDDVVVGLLALGEPGPPVLTATVDLRPDGSGRSPALRAFTQAMREAVQRYVDVRADALKSLDADSVAVAEAIEGASSDGALGLLYAGCAGAGLLVELETPYPFRNSVHVGESAWIFEVVRYQYLAGRSMFLVEANLHTMTARRLRYGIVDASAKVDWAKHHLAKHKQRTKAEGFGARETGAGGHAMNKVEQVVEARRAQFAAEATGELERLIEPGELVVLASS